jgi:hypothetical protein
MVNHPSTPTKAMAMPAPASLVPALSGYSPKGNRIMTTSNALASFISLIHGDRATTLDAAVVAFTADYGHFARSNNREPLNAAVKALKKAPKDKAISEAISDAYKAGALVNGYIGAQSGPFKAQPDDIRAMFDGAIANAATAFLHSLESSEAFADKVEKTMEEKAKAKADKADKATAAADALITAKVQAGELVRASDVMTLDQHSSLALCEALERMHASAPLSDGTMAVLRGLVGYSALLAQLVTVTSERDALVTERDALVTARAPKAKAKATAA